PRNGGLAEPHVPLSNPQSARSSVRRCVVHWWARKAPPPRARSHTDDPAEHAREMSLITKSACERDLRERLVSAQHQLLRPRHAGAGDIGGRSLPEGVAKGEKEIARAQQNNGGEVARPNRGVEVRVDVPPHAFGFPSR